LQGRLRAGDNAAYHPYGVFFVPKPLTSADRMRLVQFVCSFAWADLEIRPQERRFVELLVERLELNAAERARAQAWLELPPDPDPMEIPADQRTLFLEVIKGVIASDGEIAEEESESLALLEALLDQGGS